MLGTLKISHVHVSCGHLGKKKTTYT